MTFENCNLFRRSFTTQGLGYTFNNEREEKMIKRDFRNNEFLANLSREPSSMKSTNAKNSLHVVIENYAEETLTKAESPNFLKHMHDMVSVSLHNPKEPGDTKFTPLTSVKVPLGHSTTFLITPKAREIDDSGKHLTESQRGCRLNEDTDLLDVFNVYTRTSCLLECKIKFAVSRCGCTPWNYPVNMNIQVRQLIICIIQAIKCKTCTFCLRGLCFVTFMVIYVLRT